ncbi:hypothetical protein [Vampirovibrio sp.]|uniref:hypothetical protein n=1 Tax=Vampirovibrio sp. TaxID=2717857 RepID=UPI0035948331
MAALPRRLMSFVLLIVAMTGMSLFSLAYRLLKWVLRFCFGLAGGGAILILAFYGLIYAVSPGKLKPDDWAALWNGESVMTVIFMGGLALYVAILFLETWLIRLAQPPLQRFWQWGFR